VTREADLPSVADVPVTQLVVARRAEHPGTRPAQPAVERDEPAPIVVEPVATTPREDAAPAVQLPAAAPTIHLPTPPPQPPLALGPARITALDVQGPLSPAVVRRALDRVSPQLAG